MSYVTVETKHSEIDGKPISWNVLQIGGTIDGITNTLELKLSKTEAMLARLLLNSNESLQTVNGNKGENIIVSRKTSKKENGADFLET